MEQLRRSGALEWIRDCRRPSAGLDPWPIAARADNIVLVVAGGGHPTNAYWLPACCPHVIGRAVDVPSNFEQLLADADRELGSSTAAVN